MNWRCYIDDFLANRICLLTWLDYRICTSLIILVYKIECCYFLRPTTQVDQFLILMSVILGRG